MFQVQHCCLWSSEAHGWGPHSRGREESARAADFRVVKSVAIRYTLACDGTFTGVLLSQNGEEAILAVVSPFPAGCAEHWGVKAVQIQADGHIAVRTVDCRQQQVHGVAQRACVFDGSTRTTSNRL